MTEIDHNPIIGIVLDYDTKTVKDGGYSNFPWYALRFDYAKAVANNGGTPIHIPYIQDSIEHYLKMCDGIIIPGGDYDIDPSYYGQKLIDKVNLSGMNDRTEFELKLLGGIFRDNIPMLGICAGEQLLNVGLGGTLYEDINHYINTSIQHKHGNGQNIDCHDIDIVEGTKLHKIMKTKTLHVNSHHHQAVRDLGEGLIVNARTADGVIEGIEHQTHPFCLGLEWHPEYESHPEESAIFKALIEAAKQHKNLKNQCS